MKKFFNILFAAVISAFVLASCAEKEIVVYTPENAVAPVLNEITPPDTGFVLVDGRTFATLTFSKADFGVETAIRYTAYADIDESFANKQSLGNVATDTAGLTVSCSSLNNALMSFECTPDEPVTVYFRIEANMMGESSTVGTVAALESNAVSAQVIPYNAEKVYPAVYVIGAFCGWDHSKTAFLFSYTEDEENYVGVVDFGAECADYGFKLTGAANWDNGNWGTGDMTSTDPEASSITLWNDGGSGNITNYSSHRYYNFHFVKSSLTLNMIKGFDLVTVAGAFNGWATDATPMEQIRSNGKFYVDIDVDEAGAADGFKFVIDNGGTWLGPNEIEGAEDHGNGNITLEPGQYRFYLDLNDWENPTYSLSTADYGKPVDGGGSEPEPEPEPEPDPGLQENLWGVIGTFAESNWSKDIYMTEFPAGSGVWVSPLLEFADTTQFKLRFNNDWNTQAGAVNAGDTLRTGVPVTAGYGNNVAQNVGVAEGQCGQRVIVYDAGNNQLYLLGWGIIGAVAGDSWAHDFPMIYDEGAGTWSASGVQLDGEFKLRWGGRWGDAQVTVPDRGLAEGASFAVGTPINLAQGGSNIVPDAGRYDLVYNVADETLTVTAAE